jgi:hypothetical protein
MAKHDDGGPAFASPAMSEAHFGNPCGYPGMTREDYFAGQAMQALLGTEAGRAIAQDMKKNSTEPFIAVLARAAWATGAAMTQEKRRLYRGSKDRQMEPIKLGGEGMSVQAAQDRIQEEIDRHTGPLCRSDYRAFLQWLFGEADARLAALGADEAREAEE